jgi:dipeptidyl aminopeptidase/acylaminoacyl peptidase
LLPGSDIASIVDAPATPIARLAPGGRFIALVHYEPHPPVAHLARPFLPLAGIRIDPALAGRQRARRLTGLSILRLADGTQRALPVPDGARVSAPTWAPDGRHLAFTVDENAGIAVWVADAETGTASRVPGLIVRDVLGGDPVTPGAAARWSRDGRSLIALGAPGEPPALPQVPIEPHIEETAGKRSQMATYQDLLRTSADEDAFEALATTIPLRVDPATGDQRQLGPPGLYRQLAESPDGAHLLVYRLRRPFSFRVPCFFFARTTEVWGATGGLERVVADLGVSDEVPRQGVPEGPRQVSWEERAPASLNWVEALDGGDPIAPAAHRDRVMRLAAPFAGQPEPAFDLRHRCVYWADLDEPHRILLIEHDRDRRWLTTWHCDLAAPERNRVLFDNSADDAYADPGTQLMTTNADGSRTVIQDGQAIYLRGEGATPDGDRPFLDRLDLASARTTRIFQSPTDCVEEVIGFIGGGRDDIVGWRQSPADPPNLFAAALDGSGRRQLTSWPDPHPQLTGLTKQLVTHDRGDGVLLSGMLHLPPGHRPGADGRLPLVIWAYPVDYGDAGTAGQVLGSSMRFTRLSGLEPAWFVLRGYAVLAAATIPVIGDPETMNDTYIEQTCMAARAHIRALDELGIIDPARVAVGGHSYGGFMTANLLAHTDLFAAGIARSGAYNRTLTPFGFQTERRSFWEASEIYDRMSPFRYANKIAAPLLLIHGMQDNNPGTYTVQSQRLFQAVQGNGGTARLVLLPHESHAYLARESVLQVLGEQFGWLERWLGPQPDSDRAADG